jgi:hypothetical protein
MSPKLTLRRWISVLLSVFVPLISYLAISPSASKALAPSATPTTWLITVDVSGNKLNNSSYSLSSPVPGTCWKPSADPIHLRVCQGDTVQWVVKVNNLATLKHLSVFLHHPFLDDPTTSKPARRFESLNGTPIGGAVDSNTTVPDADEEYPYSVAIDDGNHSYSHEPKIIVGDGQRASQTVARLVADSIALQTEISKDPEKYRQETRDLVSQLVNIAKQLSDTIHRK